MTSPQDPFSSPDDQSSQSGDPGRPSGQPGGYGQPAGYGQPGGFDQPGGYGQPGAQKQGTNGLAIASLVTAFLCSPLGIGLGIAARSQIKQTHQSGDGLALAGIIIGAVSLVIGILAVAGGLATAP